MAFQASKAPDETKPFVLNWANDLINVYDGDEISFSNWTADTGIVLTSQSYGPFNAFVTVSGGTDNNSYVLTNVIETQGGLTLSDTITLLVKQ